MDSEERSFLDAILAHPADDVSRLVYADWLTEKGQEERAEFIRVQIELARMKPPQKLRALTIEQFEDVWEAEELRSSSNLHLRKEKAPKVFGRGNTARVLFPPEASIQRGEVIDIIGGTYGRVVLGALVKEARLTIRGVEAVVVHDGKDNYSARDRLANLQARERDLLDLRNPLADNVHLGDAWFSGSGFQMVTHGSAGPDFLYPPDPHSFRAWHATIERGFVSAVHCDPDQWAAHANTILRAQPVESVRLTTEPILAGAAYGSVWIPGDPERKAFPLAEVDRAARALGGSAGTVREAVLQIRAVLSLRWPGIAFELPG